MAWGAKESDHAFMEYQLSQEKFVEAGYLLVSFTTHPLLFCSNYCSGMERMELY